MKAEKTRAVNRVLRVLRERKLLTVRSGRATIHDLKELAILGNYQSVAHFDTDLV